MTNEQACYHISEAAADTEPGSGSSAFMELSYFLLTGQTFPLTLHAHNRFTKELNSK